MREPIFRAIRGRYEIEFTYEGHHRVVAPVAFANSDSLGVEMLWGQQTGGSCSGDAELPQWRLFDLRKIEDLNGSPPVGGTPSI